MPGIGDYTAAAIAAIAFGRDAVVIDTNVARVVARLHALEHPSRGEIRTLVGQMTPADGAGDFAQAMMDLGATICRPKAPNCPACPLNPDCLARASGNPEAYPARAAKRVRPQRHGIAQWIERDGAVWLVRRPPHGLLGGMAALPGSEWAEAEPPIASTPLARVRHVFTHFALELIVVPADPPAGDGWWQPLDRLGEAACRRFTAAPPKRCLADAGKDPKPRPARLKKRPVLPKGQALHDTRWPGRAEYRMQDRFTTIAGWVLFAGIVASRRFARLGRSVQGASSRDDGLSDRGR